MASSPQFSQSGQPPLPIPALPLAHLESLRSKANSIINSVLSLRQTILANGTSVMPSWPEVLSKYNIILSQTHNFSNTLINPFPSSGGNSGAAGKKQQNIFQSIAVHPKHGLVDMQQDSEAMALLRSVQVAEVLEAENVTVRRMSEHMAGSRGSLGVLGMVPPPQTTGMYGQPRKPEYEDVLEECKEIREEHDRRVERAVRAVAMLREKFDWKQRVEVQEEEPEELPWDPRLALAGGGGASPSAPEDVDVDDEMGSPSDDDDDEDDEENVADVLVNPESSN